MSRNSCYLPISSFIEDRSSVEFTFSFEQTFGRNFSIIQGMTDRSEQGKIKKKTCGTIILDEKEESQVKNEK